MMCWLCWMPRAARNEGRAKGKMSQLSQLGRRFVTMRTRRSQGGSSTVEFAIVALLFFTLLFGIIDFGRLFFAQMTIQHALRQAGRFGVTGNKVDPDGAGPQPTMPRLDSIKYVAEQAAAGLDLTSIQIQSAAGGTNNAGGPGDTMTISLTSSIKLFTPLISNLAGMKNGYYVFTASTTFKNEPFDQSQTN